MMMMMMMMMMIHMTIMMMIVNIMMMIRKITCPSSPFLTSSSLLISHILYMSHLSIYPPIHVSIFRLIYLFIYLSTWPTFPALDRSINLFIISIYVSIYRAQHCSIIQNTLHGRSINGIIEEA